MPFLSIKRFFYGLFYENNEPSLTRCIVGAAFIVFVIGTAIDIILAYSGKIWQSYQTFATITGGGSIGAKLADKISNNYTAQKYGQPPAVKNPGSNNQ